MSGPSTNEPFVFDSAAIGTANAGQGQAGNGLGRTPAQAGGDSLVRQTQREISHLLRELASAARDPIAPDKFLSILCDRTLRAMSAEGVVIWQSDPIQKNRYQPVARLGQITDRNFIEDADVPNSNRSAAWLAHQTLLATVYADSTPVVVPSTPDATQPDVPANPASVPAALVVIDCGTDRCIELPHHVIEVFLEPDGGIAAQRGYLRFVCQVADLAGEYFRSRQLRVLLDQQALAEKCDRALVRFQQTHDRHKLAALIVDQLAEIFKIDRMAISQCLATSKTRIVAVSHVESVDQHSDSAQQIRETSQHTIDAGSAVWFSDQPKISSDYRQHNAELELTGDDPQTETQRTAMYPLFVIAANSIDSGSRDYGYRLTGFSRDDPHVSRFEDFQKRELVRVTGYAMTWLHHLDPINQSRWRSWLANGFKSSDGPAHTRSQSQTLTHRLWRATCLSLMAVAVAIVMVIPVPKTIKAPATLRAQDTWRACATRDCVVETIHVDHGQRVRQGDVLMTLSDSSLDQQLTQLVGRRAVLAEQKIRLTQQMMDSSTSDFAAYESVQSQRSIVDEEIAAINQQMALLRRIEQSLTIRSDRDGIVDAWRIHKRLGGRPVGRGDVLLQVVSLDSDWVVDAEVAQSRFGRVQTADQQNELSAVVTLDESPGMLFQAKRWQFGPTSMSDVTDQASTEVTLLLGAGNQTSAQQSFASSRNGSPAQVLFHCGQVPLADLLLGDLYRDLKTTCAMHWQATSAGNDFVNKQKKP